MRKSLLTGLMLQLFTMVGFAPVAFAADWSVVQTSGDVAIHTTGVQPISLSVGIALGDGGVLTTGSTGRAMLVRGEETMIVGPNSVIGIPQGTGDSSVTTILQSAGVVEFNVERRNVRHFSIETPYLAAVVKGTRFAVGVFGSAGVVKVARGRVEVTDLVTGQYADVLPGQQADVRRHGGLSVAGEGELPQVLQGQPRPPRVNELLAALGVGGGNGFGIGNGRALGIGNGLALGVGNGPVGGGGGNGIGLGVGGGSASVNAGGVGLGLGKNK